MQLDDIQEACTDVGLSPEEAREALIGRLLVYYEDLAADQSVLQQLVASSNTPSTRYHPYSSVVATSVDPDIRSALRE